MKIGDLVRVKNTTTGDPDWMVKLWRERTPVLIVALNEFGWPYIGTPEGLYADVLVNGEVKTDCPMFRLVGVSEVCNESN